MTDIPTIAASLSEAQRRPWVPRQQQWPWHDFLTADEAAIVADVERRSMAAKQMLAEATAILNPIRNRAIHRAKYDAEKARREGRDYLEGKSS